MKQSNKSTEFFSQRLNQSGYKTLGTACVICSPKSAPPLILTFWENYINPISCNYTVNFMPKSLFKSILAPLTFLPSETRIYQL